MCNDRIEINLREIKNRFFEIYNQKNKNIHELMFDPNGNTDRHKVASLFAYTIMEIYPFPRESENNPYYYANEILAIYLSVEVLRSFIKSKKREKWEYFKNSGSIVFPTTDHCDYREELCRLLHYYKSTEHFDVMGYAHILYWIELYSYWNLKE